MAKPPKPAGPAPGRAQLHEAALHHLSRFATTEVGLVRVLDRRVQRWGRLAASEGAEIDGAVATARSAARAVAKALVESGTVNDAAFAAARSTRLVRAGRSRLAVAAHLAAKGVQADTAHAAMPAVDEELPAALAFLRRRRLGPFGAPAPRDADSRLKALAALGRAGFPRDIAERGLDMDEDEALALVLAFKRG